MGIGGRQRGKLGNEWSCAVRGRGEGLAIRCCAVWGRGESLAIRCCAVWGRGEGLAMRVLCGAGQEGRRLGNELSCAVRGQEVENEKRRKGKAVGREGEKRHGS